MYLYRVQITKSDLCQVDLASEVPLTADKIIIAATVAGNQEFGNSDETTVESVELIEEPEPTNTPT